MAKQQIQPQTNNTPAILTDEEALAREFAGAGVSNKAADNIVPQVRVLQPLSPEIVEGKLPNAKAGDFLMGQTIIPGQEGFWFQPCFWDQQWFEFLPLQSGGGFVASYPWLGEHKGRPIPPQGAKVLDDYHFKMGDNELIHYRQWSGLAWINKSPLERVINFKSTGHTVARNWNNAAREANRFSDGSVRPLFMHIYHLTTERNSNAKGTWYQISVGNPVLLSAANEQAKQIVGNDPIAVVRLGSELYKAFQGGERVAEVDTPTSGRAHDDNIPF